MEGENETLDTSTSTEQLEASQTVETSESETSDAGTPETSTETTSETPRKFADKYSTVEELEAAYKRSNSEASRMAQQLANANRPTPVQAAEKPKYTESQLEDWKEGRILEVANAQAAAAQAYSSGDISKAQQAEQIAKDAAKQIRMIDAELRNISIASTLGSQKKAQAEGKMLNDAVTVLRQFADELVEGTDLHTKASEFMEGFVAMGMSAESPLVQAHAVSMAAQILGLGSKKVAVDTRKQLTNTINQALKAGVTQGAGKAAPGKGGAPDFMKMTDAQFRDYKAARGW
ncbi:MAG: hypothetical protein ACRCZI_10375 [Cetobacterium sp.]